METQHPPQHRVDAPMRYIPPGDHWDTDRALAELDGIPANNKDRHPIAQYRSGLTRFDLDAPGWDGKRPREYLKPGHPHPTWMLRRLPVRELTACLDLVEQGRTKEAHKLAFQLGVKGLEGGPEGLVFQPAQGQACGEHELDQVAEYMGTGAIFDVGRAALAASQRPTRAEGKPFGS